MGGTVDAATVAAGVEDIRLHDAPNPNASTTTQQGGGAGGGLSEATEAVLYQAWKATPALFGRDAETRRGRERKELRDKTGLSDEMVEGFGVMVNRDQGMKRRLERKFGDGVGAFSGQQVEIGSTRWRDRGGEEVNTDTDTDGGGGGGSRGGYGGRGRGGGGGPGRGRGRGGRGGGGGARGGGEAGGSGSQAPESDLAKRRKEASKGSRANHNRRDQRAKKMARGGFGGA